MADELYLSDEYKEVQTYTKQQNLNKTHQSSLRSTNYCPYHFIKNCKENVYKLYNGKKFSRPGKKY